MGGCSLTSPWPGCLLKGRLAAPLMAVTGPLASTQEARRPALPGRLRCWFCSCTRASFTRDPGCPSDKQAIVSGDNDVQHQVMRSMWGCV